MIHQMRGRVGHAPASTRWTKAPSFAGIWDNPIQSAGIAVNPQKVSDQNAAIKKRAQFPLHEPGHQTAALRLPGQESREMRSDYPIENAAFWIAGAVLGLGFRYR